MPNHELYKLVLDEYRFQVQLNWDRTKFFLTANLTLLGITIAVLNAGNVQALGAFLLFVIGFLVSVAGNRTLIKGHQYYRAVAFRKAKLEQTLGLGESAVASTAGQQELSVYAGLFQYWILRPFRPGSVTIWLARLFWCLAGINVLGVIYSLIKFL